MHHTTVQSWKASISINSKRWFPNAFQMYFLMSDIYEFRFQFFVFFAFVGHHEQNKKTHLVVKSM